ncbi:MAG: hypothetical protein JWM74_1553 [Myxococcaceae bacterium]|nr:hypothetical protein [Myxococcaceae bacterium]
MAARPRTVTALLLHVMAAVLACAVGHAAPVFSGLARGPSIESSQAAGHHVAVRRSPSVDRGATAVRADGGHEPDALSTLAIVPSGGARSPSASAREASTSQTGSARPHTPSLTSQLGARGPPLAAA